MACVVSGQKINLKKSSIALFAGVDEEGAQKISRASRIRVKAQLEKYLGVPSIMGRTNLGLFHHLLNCIEGGLEGWKSKQLTLVGWIILAKLVLTTTPIYSMQSTLLPVAFCNNIDQKVRNFIWGSSKEKKKVRLARWEIVMNTRIMEA